ncbi:hypothetical protein [Methanofollis fontis]|uniref:Uncharacterized protein n=1 Tax=Methanofollis fontis TaxID=2052832 RepID=A0A483CUD4_9EURY|nr:hypothetical protein [Methanofollis fontis]TAJ44908.1 hypothetical protein CUJ86_06400 [Methanofollis fontis]
MEIQKIGNTSVEVGVYRLTSQQIGLAIEFNAHARISPPAVQQERSTPGRRSDKGSGRTGRSVGVSRLQVPRGSFSEMKKGVFVREVLEEFASEGFTGYGIFSGESGTFSLVFSGGICILAESAGLCGSDALQDAQHLSGGFGVSIYSLTAAQINLACEFNQRFLIEGPIKGGSVRGTVPEPPVRSGTAVRENAGMARHSLTRSATFRPKPAPKPEIERIQERVGVRSEGIDPTLKHLAALDSIDALEMARDLKAGYISILDRLELGHLVDEEKE